MNIPIKLLTACSLIVFYGCTETHLINNKVYLSQVEKDYSAREKLAVRRSPELFSVFNRKLSLAQVEALKFLFAYSPLNDLADYNGDFFLENTDIALKVRKETDWAKTIPEDIFLHYILPFRINNENPDSFRIAYYDEIKKRIAGLNEIDASLEINHWCHEKVTYMPSDIRTSGPLSTILSARGRCGEESTFTVAALRTAGIPARQVYTPRWAHSDDNHAWVEVWINGKWFYMGACEPEPVLDRGWFTEPARRAMLIHSKSFGPSGNENSVLTSRNYSEINNLSKYAETKTIYVRVLDKENSPVPDAMVEYQLYNYAEFYPIAAVPTDSQGISRFETGLGDLVIWARKGEDFNFRKISVNEVDTILIRIGPLAGNVKNIDLDLGVPVVKAPFKGPDEKAIAENNRRNDIENGIRQKYIDSWVKPEEKLDLALRSGFDTLIVKDIIKRSMGNCRTIAGFISKSPSSGNPSAIELLKVITDKDLRDITEDVLSDHLNNVRPPVETGNSANNEIYNKYILNPRIANEKIVAWRGYFLRSLPEDIKEMGEKDPVVIIRYLNDNIKIADSENYYGTPITPRGVFELKVSDTYSRDICFTAICRTLGIPARLEPGTNLPQYFLHGVWIDAVFANKEKQVPGKGYIRLITNDKNPVPEYYLHFTLARFENGRYNTLEFDYNRRVTDFKDELTLPAGHYMLVTGNRISDSRILSSISFLDLGEKEHKSVKIELRKPDSPVETRVNTKRKLTGSEQ
jgi:transglutaminase-like putative cysteine protease